jgi:uncharacterized damage-inducible protein DinB
MAVRTFAPWVEPIAAEMRKVRAEIAQFARSAPPALWAKPSPNYGWTNKDLLAHLATSHWVIQANISACLDARPFRFIGPDEGNAERVAVRREASVRELAAEVEAEGEESDQLLSRLTPDHENFRREGTARTLAEILQGLANHDPHHLRQLRESLKPASHG